MKKNLKFFLPNQNENRENKNTYEKDEIEKSIKLYENNEEIINKNKYIECNIKIEKNI